MNSYIAGFILPLIFLALCKRRGVPADVDVGGQPGFVVRNACFESPVTSLWEGLTTPAELFERSCLDHSDRPFLGSRELISRELETDPNGRTFEKLHLSGDNWVTYSKAFEAVVCFASGLSELGHYRDERAAIFADTREEWFISLQGCFRRHVTVVTIYASLGEEALTHSLNEFFFFFCLFCLCLENNDFL